MDPTAKNILFSTEAPFSDTVIIVNVNMKRQISLSGSRGIRSLQPAQDLVIECFYLKKIVLCFTLLSFSLLKSLLFGQ